MNKLIYLIVFSTFSAYANDYCKSLNPATPKTEFFINYGAPYVKKVPKNQMVKLTGSEKGVGITEAKFSITYKVSIETIKTEEGVCIYLKKAEVLYGYPQMKISINEDFEEGSCQYKETLKHENQHVNVHQQLLKKYSNDLEQTTKNIVKNIIPVFVENEEEVSETTDKLIDKIDNNPKLQKIRRDFERQRHKTNSDMDTLENYQEITAKCKSW